MANMGHTYNPDQARGFLGSSSKSQVFNTATSLFSSHLSQLLPRTGMLNNTCQKPLPSDNQSAIYLHMPFPSPTSLERTSMPPVEKTRAQSVVIKEDGRMKLRVSGGCVRAWGVCAVRGDSTARSWRSPEVTIKIRDGKKNPPRNTTRADFSIAGIVTLLFCKFETSFSATVLQLVLRLFYTAATTSPPSTIYIGFVHEDLTVRSLIFVS
ncbi:hypothetical protein BDV93DRAFT_512051 [Ceratobasidium sp. AG-I]|nr:hypothetical protein BDV93DRAFT_512051 [Ceratobasidium sp. AG-I]